MSSKSGILEVLRKDLEISRNSLLVSLSHLKMVIVLPLPQRSKVTTFWKLLGHYCKGTAWTLLQRHHLRQPREEF